MTSFTPEQPLQQKQQKQEQNAIGDLFHACNIVFRDIILTNVLFGWPNKTIREYIIEINGDRGIALEKQNELDYTSLLLLSSSSPQQQQQQEQDQQQQNQQLPHSSILNVTKVTSTGYLGIVEVHVRVTTTTTTTTTNDNDD